MDLAAKSDCYDLAHASENERPQVSKIPYE